MGTMLKQGPIPLTVHAMLEPVIAALLIAAPFLFGFSDRGAPTAASIVAGVLVLLIGMSTKWRVSLVKVIPVPIHATMDLVLAVLLIAAPFIFAFSDETAPTVFFLAVGVGQLLVALATRWRTDDHAGRRPRRGRRSEPLHS
jgi:peptidoglycan/LPS O-acetylase OafA/YrhL